MSELEASDSAAPQDGETSTETQGRRPANRRDLILAAAIELFDERGYPATGVDDIGKAVNVSGPAIYRHFSSKEEILVEAIRLAADEVHAVNRTVRESGSEPRDVLRGYVQAYTHVALGHSSLIAVWTSEARHLSNTRRSPMTRRLRSWTREWTDVLTEARPEISNDDAMLLVAGAIGLITSVATNNALHLDDIEERIIAMAMAALDAEIH